MRLGRLTVVGLAAIAASVAVAAPASGGADAVPAKKAKAKAPVKVTVADDYFAPIELKIKKGRSVRWVWANTNFNSHNVRLAGAKPKKVKRGRFASPSGTIGLRFQRKFNVVGMYGFVCSLHRTVMKMTVRVRK